MIIHAAIIRYELNKTTKTIFSIMSPERNPNIETINAAILKTKLPYLTTRLGNFLHFIRFLISDNHPSQRNLPLLVVIKRLLLGEI